MPYDSMVCVFGCCQDKDIGEMLDRVNLGADKVIFTRAQGNPRAAAPEEDLDSSIHGGAPLEPAEHGSGNTSRAESVDTSDPVIEMPDATPDKDQPAA